MVVESLSKMVDQKQNMKKITLSLTDKTEAKLRGLAKDKYGNMKGALSLIVENALQRYFLDLKDV